MDETSNFSGQQRFSTRYQIRPKAFRFETGKEPAYNYTAVTLFTE